MIKIIAEISKYLLLFLMIFFTLEIFIGLSQKNEDMRKNCMRKQMLFLLLFNFVAYFIMFLQTNDIVMLLLYVSVVFYVLLIHRMYCLFYKKASFILVNIMCMLLSIGFIIQIRLDVSTAIKQFIIVAGASVFSFIIPVFVKKVKLVKNLHFVYSILGLLLLTLVFLFAQVNGGGKLSINIGGISFQFSEFVKITFVFFIASMLQKVITFRQVFWVTVIAGIHMVILTMSKDLGAALIYFVAYIVMVYIAPKQNIYALLGLSSISVTSIIACRLFAHVRSRIRIWKNPFFDYQNTGYQIAQALFGICSGSWFGTGLFAGSPNMIPLAKEDFTFAAICEEMGILFAICLILLCMCTYVLIVNIAIKIRENFYKLIAIGLSTEYAFQVFLTIGGTTNLIPMTGITLPLISYGGSSVMCTIMMFAIIQGLYLLKKDEDEELEEKGEKQTTSKQLKKKNDHSDRGKKALEREAENLERKIEKQTEKSFNW